MPPPSPPLPPPEPTEPAARSALAALALHDSPSAFIVLDEAARVQWWSDAAESLFGYEAREAEGRPLDELLLHGGEPAARDQAQAFDRARRGWRVVRERACRRRDGVLLYVNESLRAGSGSGGARHVVAVLTDVTALRVQRDSQLVVARYQGVLEYAPDAIVIVNDVGRIVLFNARAREMFDRPSAEVIGEPIEMLLPARLRQAHVRHRSGFLAAPRMRPMGAGLELHGVRRNGEEFPVEISLSPIDSDGLRLVMSAIRDTSERRRFEQALREKNEELERAIRAKDLFLATMSHELRTPLNAIIGFTGLMLMKLPGPLTPAQERQLTLVQSSGQHLLSLINDLLDLAKIESGRVELHYEDVPCRALLEEVAATLRPAAGSKGLSLRVEVAGDRGEGGEACESGAGSDVVAHADRRALHQIVLNLGSNAVKFTPQGEVLLQASLVHRAAGPPSVEIAVVDTGVGISAEDQARLFQAFTQLGPRSGRPAEGTGLGLHLSRKLADLMQGTLRVTSEPGRGSRFVLTLAPAQPGAAAGSA